MTGIEIPQNQTLNKMAANLSNYLYGCIHPPVHPSIHACIQNTHLIEVLLSEVRDGFVYLQIVGQFDVLRALHHVHTPGRKRRPKHNVLTENIVHDECFLFLFLLFFFSAPKAKPTSQIQTQKKSRWQERLAWRPSWCTSRPGLFCSWPRWENGQRNVGMKGENIEYIEILI